METFFLVILLLGLVPALVIAIVGLVLSARAARRQAALDQSLQRLERTMAAVLRQLSVLRSEEAPPAGKAEAPVSAGPTIAPPIAQPPPLPQPPPVHPPRPVLTSAPQDRTVEATPLPRPLPPRPPAPPSPPPPATPPVPPQPPLWSRIDWEGLVGVKLFSWIAGIAFVIAAVLFLRYAVDQGYLTPPIRMALGVMVGAGLLVLCEVKAARRYDVTANALEAAGIAILFSTFFASNALWHLLDLVPTFVLMILVTAVAVALSLRHNSLFIAVLGLLGGFATPAVLSTGEDRPFGLFGYLLLLNIGLAWVAYRKNWPHLTTLSLLFTFLYQWGWFLKFPTTSNLPIAAVVFLLFPLLNVLGWQIGTRRDASGQSPRFGQSAIVGAALPLFFACHAAAVPAYAAQYLLIFTFLLCVDAGLAAIAIWRGPEILHVIGGVTTVVVFATYLGRSYVHDAWPGVLLLLIPFVTLYAAAGTVSRAVARPFGDTGWRAGLAAPVLLFAIAVLAGIEPSAAAPALMFGTLFGLLALIAALALLEERGAMYFLGAFFAVAAEAVWSARYLVPERLLPALAVYAVFGMFYLGVPLLARRLKRELRPEGAAPIILLLSLGLLFFLAGGTVASVSLWGLSLLLLILNLGLFLEGGGGGVRRVLTIAGLALSWVLIAVWWANAELSQILVPALLMVGGFAVLVLGGNIWLQKRLDRTSGISLALAGHLFIFFVALQHNLSVPPWPMLAVLGVLDLAIGVAALYQRQAGLHLAAVIASAAILAVWAFVVGSGPWAETAIFAAIAVALFAVGWVFLSWRVGAQREPDRFALAAVAGLFGAQAVAIVASAMQEQLGVATLLPAHLLCLVLLLALSYLANSADVACWSVLPVAVATLLWRALHPSQWGEALLFATPLYVAFLLNPLALGDRAKKRIQPYLAAVLANGAFFIVARRAIIEGGYGNAIGILPVVQAGLLAVLLLHLLKLEPAGQRWIGRLALVAGAALAFIAVAIPLQLEKQWITIGWALQATALLWLYRRVPHRGLLYGSSGLFVAVFVRLVNPAVFEYSARAAYPVFNWYLYAYLVAAGAFFAGARYLRGTDERLLRVAVSKPLIAAGTLLLFALLNLEIADFFTREGSRVAFRFTGDLSQNLTYTIGWALFAIGLLVAGIIAASRATRVAAILLLAFTVFKCFLFDLRVLTGLFRVASFAGLAVCLALVAVLLQRFVIGTGEKRS